MDQLQANPAGAGLLTHALGVLSGPCSFLPVVPPTFSRETRVDVVYRMPQYIKPASQPNLATVPMQG
jgi:hypothetical protein